MGHRVEKYSLEELHQISVPGKVAPALFWAIPVGDWNPNELDKVWRWFTESKNLCNDFGLLLVKQVGASPDRASNVSLASIAGRLSDLIPAGAERYRGTLTDGNEKPRVLVLSGSYPQPGWGVLVDWHRDINCFEELIEKVIRSLNGAEESLNAFRAAAGSFHNWHNLRAIAPPTLDASPTDSEIQKYQEALQLVLASQAGLQAKSYSLTLERIAPALKALSKVKGLNMDQSIFTTVERHGKAVVSALAILTLPEKVFVEQVAAKINAIQNDPLVEQAAYRSLGSNELKFALRECLGLRRKGIVESEENFSEWAKRTIAEHSPKLAEALAGFGAALQAELVTYRGLKAQREHEYQLTLHEWKQDAKKARESFHLHAGRAVQIQWELGPRFLVELEKAYRLAGLFVRSIPWDPARMVGWKILSANVRINSSDLQMAAQELVPGTISTSVINKTESELADGSYFTDYVHYIAISRPGHSPRAVTLELLERLLRPSEMMNLIYVHGGKVQPTSSTPQLAEELLLTFGWQDVDRVREKPLAACINGDVTSPRLVENLTGNDLRIVLESFCKDVVDVVVAQLGSNHAEVWSAIDENIPTYRPSSRSKDWDEEVELMTVGAAAMILPALARIAFPNHTSEVNEFVLTLDRFAKILNRSSHHQAGPAIGDTLNEAPALILALLQKAEYFLGELPWHLEASFSYGEQPKVVSGEAWSHGSSTPRMLRVIVWTGFSPGKQFTFWNKQKRNPVVPDPLFIVRPSLK